MAADKLNQAIAAFQAGDKATAKALFQEVISTDPNNDTAWYYFAALQDDPARRRAALNKVLEINPDHQRAREVLAAMDAAQASTAAAAAGGAASRPPASTAPPAPPAPPPPPAASQPPLPKAKTDAPAGAAGFALPFNIPGAPERVTIGELWQEWLAMFMAGVNVLMRKPGVYEQEIARGTWWRFWLLVVGVALISALFGLLGRLLFGGGLFGGLIAGIVTLILSPAITYVGVWASHWWAARQGSMVPQGQHATTAVIPYVPAAVITAILNIIPGFGGLLGFLVSIYAWYIMGLGFQAVHQFRDPNQSWFTVAFFILGVIGGSIVLAIIVGLLAAPFAVAATAF